MFWRGLLFCLGLCLLLVSGAILLARRQPAQPHFTVVAENVRGVYYLYRERLDDGKRWLITPQSAREYLSPTLSPDGQWIAVVNYSLHLIHLSGEPIIKLTDTLDGGASWSPDGKWLAFQSYRDGNWDIYRLHLPTRRVERLTDAPADDTSPAWSPDGHYIAFMSLRRGRTWDIFRMDADGAHQKNLTLASTHAFSPIWSPDGTRLGFYYNSISIKKITHTMSPDGTDWQLMMVDPYPEWSRARLPVIDAPLRGGGLLVLSTMLMSVAGWLIYSRI